MLHKAIQARLYPTQNQQIQVVPTLGCARWWWNSDLNKSIEVYKTTRKRLGCSRIKTLFLALKKSDGSAWLDECYSQLLPAKALNLTTAYNFFYTLPGFTKLKFLDKKLSFKYRQASYFGEENIKIFGNGGMPKPKIYRLIEGKI